MGVPIAEWGSMHIATMLYLLLKPFSDRELSGRVIILVWLFQCVYWWLCALQVFKFLDSLLCFLSGGGVDIFPYLCLPCGTVLVRLPFIVFFPHVPHRG